MLVTYYLRTRKNETLADLEVEEDDLSCVVPLIAYSRYLLRLPPEKQMSFIVDFENIQELRGAYFETSAHKLQSPRAFVKQELEFAAKKWDLTVVED